MCLSCDVFPCCRGNTAFAFTQDSDETEILHKVLSTHDKVKGIYMKGFTGRPVKQSSIIEDQRSFSFLFKQN